MRSTVGPAVECILSTDYTRLPTLVGGRDSLGACESGADICYLMDRARRALILRGAVWSFGDEPSRMRGYEDPEGDHGYKRPTLIPFNKGPTTSSNNFEYNF
ncbi:hypothetical protein G7K_0385-t1 [Saitoella complicata NRRL Y-17804]|uniref:Uncharacterized protein n=1 Tax=Saitoella complicata (strain BCRC 22490 / CBS 7301 / JCM 7358 / NBRC 10748 / NRRL Y-17804) TaxID=698492 RepID=A0A0E9N8W7_SAICN|nr:hypothetical protein G7K_0385-t1 [Saitoella complicata NRRL Y-17804]